MKRCGNPSCSYLYADDYSGPCDNCGRFISGEAAQGDLGFRFANQIRQGQRETQFEQEAKRLRSPGQARDFYSRAPVNDAVLDVARSLIVQREEVEFEDDAA